MFERNRQPEATGWLTLEECAAAVDVTPQGFSKTFRPHAPPSAVRNAGKKGVLIHFRQMLDAYIADRIAKAPPRTGDPLMDVPDSSPALERWRLARAEMEEIALAEKKHEVVAIAVMRPGMNTLISVMRNVAERLQRQFGNEASDIYNEGIDEAIKACDRMFDQLTGKPGPAHESSDQVNQKVDGRHEGEASNEQKN
ncbi:MAG TPA: hypothetical protein VH370_20495 [Humisphaera sp.]|jgi:phage terminase Nu1 subunit (DNA packaging protein)|nr:hypothetical protein [Humisphaera sp.]